VRKDDDLTTFIEPKVEKYPEALTFPVPRGLLRPVAGKLYLLVIISDSVLYISSKFASFVCIKH
jgi:hypothetical protein